MTRLLSYDESGVFVEGAFFELSVLNDPDFLVPAEERRPGTIVSPIKGGFNVRRHLYSEVLFDEKKKHTCSVHRDHYTAVRRVNHRADLFGGPTAPDLVEDAFQLTLVVNRRVRDELERSGLTGFSLVPLSIGENQSRCKTPDLFRVQFTSAECVRDMTVNVPQPNVCPFCGSGPVVCPECRDWHGACRECGKGLLVLEEEHGGAKDQRFITIGVPRDGVILEGEKWDGSDFIPGEQAFLSRHAVDWLLETGAAPFVLAPCRMDVSRMGAGEKGRLRGLLPE